MRAPDKEYDVIVIGAGPAGIIASGSAARHGGKVLLVEKMERPGRKLLITGKGRCNITYNGPVTEYFENIFPNPRFLKHAFKSFFKDDILHILHTHGVETVTERGSRVFPVKNDASVVLDALLEWMGVKNIEIACKTKVVRLITDGGEIRGILALCGHKETLYTARSVILCTGGKSYPATGSTGDGYNLAMQAGHTLTPAMPALVPLVTEGATANKLQGLALKNVNVMVYSDGRKSAQEFGEMMFSHFGLTGPVILTLSRHVVQQLEAGHKVEVSIDLKPALEDEKLDTRLLRDLNNHGKKQLVNIFKLWLPGSLIPVFIEILSLEDNKLCNQISARERRSILRLMKDFRFTIKGHPGFSEAIITSGGIPTKEISSSTMESKITRNLFFAGEIIDLDANTGGFNLQIAYSTGWLAGQNSIKSHWPGNNESNLQTTGIK